MEGGRRAPGYPRPLAPRAAWAGQVAGTVRAAQAAGTVPAARTARTVRAARAAETVPAVGTGPAAGTGPTAGTAEHSRPPGCLLGRARELPRWSGRPVIPGARRDHAMRPR